MKKVFLIALTTLFFFSCQKNLQDISKEKLAPEAISRIAEVKLDGVKELFLQNALSLNVVTGDITLPLYKGQHNGQDVWYIITESSNEDLAEKLGINFAPKLDNALGTAAVQHVQISEVQTSGKNKPINIGSPNAVVTFEGGVDFSPQRIVVPGPDGFPPSQFKAGAIGDAKYSPLITTGNGIVFNASQVANASGLHDAIISIDYINRRVTLDQFCGFYDGKKVLYLHQDASVELVAAVEGSTLAPNLNAAPGLGSNDKETSAREAIIPIVNGERGVFNPDRQGLQSALLGEGDPLNIIQEEPGDEEYSPVWDLHLVVWTQAAINAGKRKLLTSAGKVEDAFKKGLVVSGEPNSGVMNPSLGGLKATGAISNCPVSALLRGSF
jgi:hypothetical protein